MAHEYLDIDLKQFIEKLQNFKLIEFYKFNRLLSELANYIYDTYEEIEDLNLDELENSNIVFDKLKNLLPQIEELNKILDKLYQYFDDKHMSRLVSMTFPIEESIKEKLANYQ